MRVNSARPGWGLGCDRKDVKLHGEDHQEHDAAHELGNDGERQTGDADHAIQDAVAAQGGQHPQHNRSRHDDHERDGREQERVDQPLQSELQHRLPQDGRFTPPADEEVTDPVRVAQDERLVDAELVIERGHLRR